MRESHYLFFEYQLSESFLLRAAGVVEMSGKWVRRAIHLLHLRLIVNGTQYHLVYICNHKVFLTCNEKIEYDQERVYVTIMGPRTLRGTIFFYTDSKRGVILF